MENQRHLEVILEDMNSKLDLLIEGHQSLQQQIHDTKTELKEDIGLCNFKIDTLNQKIDGVKDELNQKIDGVEDKLFKKIDGVEDKLSKKIDGVAADLKAHRADTEAHHGVYQVKEC